MFTWKVLCSEMLPNCVCWRAALCRCSGRTRPPQVELAVTLKASVGELDLVFCPLSAVLGAVLALSAFCSSVTPRITQLLGKTMPSHLRCTALATSVGSQGSSTCFQFENTASQPSCKCRLLNFYSYLPASFKLRFRSCAKKHKSLLCEMLKGHSWCCYSWLCHFLELLQTAPRHLHPGDSGALSPSAPLPCSPTAGEV